MTAPQHPFDRLTPQAVLDALDGCGLRGDGRLLQLNSYENRVFQVFLDDGQVVVAKFYRPGRWTDDQIAEEHAFALELSAADVPVVAPLTLANGGTLAQSSMGDHTFRFAVYPRRSGSAPDLERHDTLAWLGRFIGRMHAVGARAPFIHRRPLTPATHGREALQRILSLDIIPSDLVTSWRLSAESALQGVEEAFDSVRPSTQRLHGDCHLGNILWRDEGPHIVDLDDACTGPPIQDLWMLVAGDPASIAAQFETLLAGYRSFVNFDPRELALIEPLRTLRMLHHCAWIATRWDDPAFPAAFPWFGTSTYWAEQVTQLREQQACMAELPIDISWVQRLA